jgi:hypothetical protein
MGDGGGWGRATRLGGQENRKKVAASVCVCVCVCVCVWSSGQEAGEGEGRGGTEKGRRRVPGLMSQQSSVDPELGSNPA